LLCLLHLSSNLLLPSLLLILATPHEHATLFNLTRRLRRLTTRIPPQVTQQLVALRDYQQQMGTAAIDAGNLAQPAGPAAHAAAVRHVRDAAPPWVVDATGFRKIVAPQLQVPAAEATRLCTSSQTVLASAVDAVVPKQHRTVGRLAPFAIKPSSSL